MTVIQFVSRFVNLRFFEKKKNLLRTTQMKTTHCQTLHYFKGPRTLNEKLHALLRLRTLKTIPAAFTRSGTYPFRPNKGIPQEGRRRGGIGSRKSIRRLCLSFMIIIIVAHATIIYLCSKAVSKLMYNGDHRHFPWDPDSEIFKARNCCVEIKCLLAKIIYRKPL